MARGPILRVSSSTASPHTRGEEVTAAVIDGARSRVYREAENRLHVIKAILLDLIG